MFAATALFGVIGACAGPRAYPAPGPESGRPQDAPRQALLITAWAALQAHPDDLERAIWYGRRTAYLGDYERAVAVYTAALDRHPGDPELLRHRGHRYLSLRDFASAERDLAAAAAVIEGTPDRVEPDGLPNDRGIPTSTLHSNIWYHLALAHYCQGEFEAASRAWNRCLARAANRDMEVAARYWLGLATLRTGGDPAAVFAPVDPHWDVIENHAYHRLCLLFAGRITRDEAAAGAGAGSAVGVAVTDATLGYGLARYDLLQGADAQGHEMLRSIVADAPVGAFARIAAEQDLENPQW